MVCLTTGKYYIGLHSIDDLGDGYFGSGQILTRSIKKYGIENHSREILEFLESRESLILREEEIVNASLISDPKCLNLIPGGGASMGHEISTKIKISLSLKGRKPSPESVSKRLETMAAKAPEEIAAIYKKISTALRGQRRSEKSRERMREVQSGYIPVCAGWNKGIPRLEETKNKISEKNKKQTYSQTD
jgi:hypothetical protein